MSILFSSLCYATWIYLQHVTPRVQSGTSVIHFLKPLLILLWVCSACVQRGTETGTFCRIPFRIKRCPFPTLSSLTFPYILYSQEIQSPQPHPSFYWFLRSGVLVSCPILLFCVLELPLGIKQQDKIKKKIITRSTSHSLISTALLHKDMDFMWEF